MYTPEQIRAAGISGEINSIDVEHLIKILEDEGVKIEDKTFKVGDIVKGEFNIRTGTRSGSGRDRKNNYGIYEKKEVTGVITFDREKLAYYFETDFKQEYLSAFWRGIGSTKAERDANYMTKTWDSPRDFLYKVAHKLEVVGGIFNQ